MLKTLFATLLAVSTLTAWAAPGPASSNPDDYDVAKYQRLYEDSVIRLRNAQVLLGNLEQRVQQTEARVQRERSELANLERQVDQNNIAIGNAEGRIQQLRQSISTAQAELQQLQQVDVPNAERALQEEQRRRAALANQLAGADQNTQRAEAVARDKDQQAKALQQNADQKHGVFKQLQDQYNDVNGKLQTLEGSRTQLQKRIDDLRVRLAQLQQQLESAKSQVERLEKESAQKEQEYRASETRAAEAEREANEAEKNNDPSARGKRAKAVQMRRKADQDKGEYETAKRNLDPARAQLARIEGDLSKVRGDLTDSEKQFAQVDQQVVALRAQAADLQPKVQVAGRDFAQARKLSDDANRDAQAAQAEAANVRSVADGIRRALADTDKKIADLERLVAHLRTRQVTLQGKIGEWNGDAEREWQVVRQARARNQQLAPAVEQQRRQVAAAHQEFSLAVRDRDQAAAIVAQEERQVASARYRLEQVRENLNNAIQYALAEGRDDGANDGANEGTRQGALLGERYGLEVGEREGRAQGTREGVARARAEGRQQGDELGRTEGNEVGAREGRETGEREGTEQGRAKGLQEGYDLAKDQGYREAYPKGEQAGHAMGGFQKGRAEGYAQGKARAESEGAAKGRTDGNRQGQDEFYNANLNNVTVSNRTNTELVPETGILPAESDVKSATFEYPRWENYNPRRRYVHGEIQRAYNDSYNQNFLSSAAATYDRVYPATYQQFHAQAFEAARAEFAGRDYPEERKNAFDAARDAAYRTAHDAAFSSARTAAFGPAFEAARTAALPVRRDEGLRDGRKQGLDEGKQNAYNADLERGRSEGRDAGWNENYNNYYEAAKTAAYNEVVAYFSSNAVLKFDGAVTADANGDGVYAPGEGFSLTVAVKNFGKVSQGRPVTIELSNPSAGLVLDRPTDTLVALAGQSRVVVTDVAQVRIAPTAEVGKTESLTVTVSQDGKALGQATLTLTVGYPYAVSSVKKSDYPTMGQDNAVTAYIRNGSSKASANPVTVKFVSVDGLATVTRSVVDLGRLAPGENKAADLAFTFGEGSVNKVLNFEVQIYEGDWLLGKLRFSADATKRWAYTETATGLVVLGSSDLGKRAEEAAKLAGFAFDVWDIRVEGALTQDVALKYLGKAVVLPSVSGQLGDGTAVALRSYLERGGDVYVGMRDAARYTAVGAVLTKAEQGVSSNQSVSDLVAFQANFFQANEPKYLIVEGKEMHQETSAKVAEDLVAFEMLRKSFSDKVGKFLAAVSSGNTDRLETTRSVVLYDLVKEMRDNAAIKGENYKKNRAALRLTAFVNTALSKQGAERRAMLNFAPVLDQARKQVEKDGWFRSTPIWDTMKPLHKAYEKEVLGRKGS